MWLLAVDTSAREASVALLEDDRLAALVASPGSEQHSVRLFRDIERVLAETRLVLADIDTYAVANGPGAFTALRVGLASVKALAEMHGKPVVAVSVLEALCAHARARGLLVPIVDAYRGQVFGGAYEKSPDDIRPGGIERVLALDEFLATIASEGIDPASCTIVTSQVARFAARLAESGFAGNHHEQVPAVLADAVAWRARARLARGQVTDALRLEANYVRRSDAELLWKPK